MPNNFGERVRYSAIVDGPMRSAGSVVRPFSPLSGKRIFEGAEASKCYPVVAESGTVTS